MRTMQYGSILLTAAWLTAVAAVQADVRNMPLGLRSLGTVLVDHPGNVPDGNGLGAVAYANGLKLVFKDQKKLPTGCRFIGDRGWVRVDRQWADHPGLVALDDSLLETKLRPDDLRLYNSQNHGSNFLECVRTRKDPISDVDATHKASYFGLLTEVAGRLEQKLKWEPTTEQFIGNDEPNRLLHRQKHNGWIL